MKNDSYEDLLKKIAENLKKARKKHRITQEGMIDHGFNDRHYQRIESGKYSMNLYTLYRLSKEFDTDITTFFN